jgi:tryptophan-rich sensory protein
MKLLLLANVATPVALAALVNGIIFSRGWNGGPGGMASDLLPPGWVIALVWTVVLALLGYVHYRTFPSAASFAVLGAIAFCIMYPFLTLRRRSRGAFPGAKVLNTMTLIIAAAVLALVAARRDGRSMAAATPLFVWAAYVNIVDAIECQRKWA